MTAVATEAGTDSEIELGLKLVFTRLEEKVPDIANYKEDAKYRVYIAKPVKVWITDYIQTESEEVDGRKELDIELFKQS